MQEVGGSIPPGSTKSATAKFAVVNGPPMGGFLLRAGPFRAILEDLTAYAHIGGAGRTGVWAAGVPSWAPSKSLLE
jgi:hypothetical protein